jgi:hypothetical protein
VPQPTAHLQGAVTIDGQPVPADALASISFRPTMIDQAGMEDVEIVNGRYIAPSVPFGPVKVHISVKQFTGRMINDGGQPFKEFASLVPEQYESGIPLDVQGDNSSQDFHLTK